MSENITTVSSASLSLDKEKVTDTVGIVGDIVSSLGDVLKPIASLFGAEYSIPVVAVSEIAKEFGKLNDKDLSVLQNNVIGFSKLLDLLESQITLAKSENKDTISLSFAETLLVELHSINELRKLNNKILD